MLPIPVRCPQTGYFYAHKPALMVAWPEGLMYRPLTLGVGSPIWSCVARMGDGRNLDWFRQKNGYGARSSEPVLNMRIDHDEPSYPEN